MAPERFARPVTNPGRRAPVTVLVHQFNVICTATTSSSAPPGTPFGMGRIARHCVRFRSPPRSATVTLRARRGRRVIMRRRVTIRRRAVNDDIDYPVHAGIFSFVAVDGLGNKEAAATSDNE